MFEEGDFHFWRHACTPNFVEPVQELADKLHRGAFTSFFNVHGGGGDIDQSDLELDTDLGEDFPKTEFDVTALGVVSGVRSTGNRQAHTLSTDYTHKIHKCM